MTSLPSANCSVLANSPFLHISTPKTPVLHHSYPLPRHLPGATLRKLVHAALTKPANDAPFQSFPHENPRKTEVDPTRTRILGVSTSTPQYLVVLYLTRTTWGGTFIFTAAPGAEPVASATPFKETLSRPSRVAGFLRRVLKLCRTQRASPGFKSHRCKHRMHIRRI